MATYILLARFTQPGITHMEGRLNRLENKKQKFQSLGAELRQFHMVNGLYDFIAIFEAPDDETMAKVSCFLGFLGTIQTEILRAYSDDEYRKMFKHIRYFCEKLFWASQPVNSGQNLRTLMVKKCGG